MRVNSLLESLRQGVLICDRQGRVVYMNEAYAAFTGQDPEAAKGRKITELRAGARVPEVLKSGKAVEGVIRREGNQEYFASIYPVTEEEVVKGTISIVTTLEDQHLKTQLTHETLEERVKRFERREIQAAVDFYGGGVEGKKMAAKELGISLATLYNKMKE